MFTQIENLPAGAIGFGESAAAPGAGGGAAGGAGAVATFANSGAGATVGGGLPPMSSFAPHWFQANTPTATVATARPMRSSCSRESRGFIERTGCKLSCVSGERALRSLTVSRCASRSRRTLLIRLTTSHPTPMRRQRSETR